LSRQSEQDYRSTKSRHLAPHRRESIATHVMEKMQAKSLSEGGPLALAAGLSPSAKG
jgi:hypothetical protein